MVTAAGVKTFFHADKMGSVVAMSDTDGALVEGPCVYDAYGNCRVAGAACNGAGVPTNSIPPMHSSQIDSPIGGRECDDTAIPWDTVCLQVSVVPPRLT